MGGATFWWIVTGVLIAFELATGTFYLLMLAIGAVAGALAAYLGADLNLQMASAGIVGGVAVAACYAIRRRHVTNVPASSDPNVNLDIGETVNVSRWAPDRTAQVRYRGAQWKVIYRGESSPAPGTHRVVEIVGSQLVVEPI